MTHATPLFDDRDAAALFDAAARGDAQEILRRLPCASAGLREEALRLAAMAGREEATRLVLDFGSIDASGLWAPFAPDAFDAALAGAGAFGHIACARLLASRSPALPPGAYCLLLAAGRGHAECLATMLPLCPAEPAARALDLALARGCRACVLAILPACDDLARRAALLRSAADQGLDRPLEALLAIAGPPPGVAEALARAVENGHPRAARILLPHADPESIVRLDPEGASNDHEREARLLALEWIARHEERKSLATECQALRPAKPAGAARV
jgi:hypothetical protein